MFFSIRELELRKVRFAETYEPGTIDFSDAGMRQVAPLVAGGTAELLAHTEGEVRIRGEYGVTLEGECDRCLGPVEYPLAAQFDLFYRPMSDIAVEEEVAIDEGEAEIGFYESAGMELEDILREQVLLGLPMQKVCQEDCKGICPICGKNRNEVSCNCHLETADDRWAGLRNLE